MAKSKDNRSHRLRSLTIIGGFLDGEKFDLADGLNCIIGARGTGKTTVLEFVRYVMDTMPSDKDARKRIKALVDWNLQGGRIQLKVETKDGLAYIVSRSPGDEPMVLTEDGSPTELSLKSGGLFRVDVYSQNEIETIADVAMSQLDLIDNFEADRISSIEHQIRSVKADLGANANSILPVQKKLETLKDELAQRGSVDEKLKGYGTEGGEDSKAINEAHAAKALRDRESRAVGTIKELLEEVSYELGEIKGRIALRADTIASEELRKGPNGKLLQQVFDGLKACGSDVDNLIQQAVDRIEKEATQVEARSAKLTAGHQGQELKFRELIDKHKEAQGKATERTRLEKLRNELLAKERENKDLKKKDAELRKARTSLIQRLSELRDERFQVRKTIVDRINAALSPSIKATVEQYGNRDSYQELLEEALKPASVRRGMVAGKIVNAYSPDDLSDIIEKRDPQPLIENAELNPDQAQKVMDTLAGSNVLFKLETVELIDQPTIKLNDHGTYKETSSLSTGQKCNTILPILLLDSDNPLLIDQPEDNLDNSFVYETIVESIRKVKEKRQLIFVTHNPNIPVLGDAEKVFVMESDGTSAHTSNEGSVDECKDDIVTLLEGGQEAFDKRKARYAD